jgi:PKD repeat protein
MFAIKSLMLCLMLSIPVIAIPLVSVNAKYADLLGLTVLSDRSAYYYGEPINLTGSFTQYGQPVSNGTVAVAIYDPSGAPVAFRTVKTGPAAPPSSLVDFLELTPCDPTGTPQSTFLPQQTVWVRIAIINHDAVGHYQVTPITLFDANGVPLITRVNLFGTLGPGGSAEIIFMAATIPLWAQPGNATLSASIFSGYPKDGGTPYCEEKNVNFEIKRNPYVGYSTPPAANPQPNGTFASSFKLPPTSEPGNYRVDVSARSTLVNNTQQSLLTSQSTTLFSVLNTATPPQAAFTYYPLDSYVNMTITFDASGSTAEGYNVTIAHYQWDFGDGSPKVDTSNPVTSHTFSFVNNYTVTLNVTDSQGLWCTTSKLITILPPTGPKAYFTWYPATPKPNSPATFDATLTTLGWNGTGHPPIVNYIWNFGDSNITSGYYPTIVHTYAALGNYTAALNVTDASGFTNNATYLVRVQQITLIGDINGDGKVNILDAIILGNAFLSTPTSSNWNPNADLNGDGHVNILDAIILGNHFGQTG